MDADLAAGALADGVQALIRAYVAEHARGAERLRVCYRPAVDLSGVGHGHLLVAGAGRSTDVVECAHLDATKTGKAARV
jgi:hypothetical protein